MVGDGDNEVEIVGFSTRFVRRLVAVLRAGRQVHLSGRTPLALMGAAVASVSRMALRVALG